MFYLSVGAGWQGLVALLTLQTWPMPVLAQRRHLLSCPTHKKGHSVRTVLDLGHMDRHVVWTGHGRHTAGHMSLSSCEFGSALFKKNKDHQISWRTLQGVVSQGGATDRVPVESVLLLLPHKLPWIRLYLSELHRTPIRTTGNQGEESEKLFCSVSELTDEKKSDDQRHAAAKDLHERTQFEWGRTLRINPGAAVGRFVKLLHTAWITFALIKTMKNRHEGI